MTALVLILAVVLVAALVLLAVRERERGRRGVHLATPSAARIAFPFTSNIVSQRGLDAALRLARTEGATLVPVFLAQVPMHLPLDTPVALQCDGALPLLEAIEHRAVRCGVAVDSRIERGRSYRHALREMLVHETFDTVVVTAADDGAAGLSPDDVSWLLENVPGEIIVIRPGSADLRGFPSLEARSHPGTGRSRSPHAPTSPRAGRRPRSRSRVSGDRGNPA
ncbi:MAG TPA: hypothetical protein VHX66_11320 [Solirubrobacteraceae bacterium]|nr:hypothetical protein [Solirubrobacteraceae bacterium]